MSSSSVPYWLTLLVVVGAGYGAFKMWSADQPVAEVRYESMELTPEEKAELESQQPRPTGPPLTEFKLTQADGETFDSKSLTGDVWVGSFFYVDCPSACFKLNQAIAKLQENPALADVKFVSISCDPDNDTPERLTEYGARFKADPARWLFCRGEMDYVKRIGRDMFKVGIERQTHANYGIVIDRTGEVRGRFALTDADQLEMAKSLLAKCLMEPAPESQEAAPATPGAPQPEEAAAR